MGFGEVQFDYIRFPSRTKSSAAGVPEANGVSKPDALAAYLRCQAASQQARCAVNGRHLRTRDHSGGPLEWDSIGRDRAQRGRRLADGLSVALSARRARRGAPQCRAVQDHLHVDHSRARTGQEAWHHHARARSPWLQAFTLGPPAYGAEQLEAQKRRCTTPGMMGG